jgi:hypothetical protein
MSGARWHEEISYTLRAIGFKQSYARKDIWMQKMHNHYEYVCLYVDDMTIFSKKVQAIITALKALYNMKAMGQPEYYNGADLYKEDNYWCILSKTYLKIRAR